VETRFFAGGASLVRTAQLLAPAQACSHHPQPTPLPPLFCPFSLLGWPPGFASFRARLDDLRVQSDPEASRPLDPCGYMCVRARACVAQ